MLGLGGPSVAFDSGAGAAPPPPTAPGFVKLLGTANANLTSSVTVPTLAQASAGNAVLVFLSTSSNPTHGALALTVTGIADSIGTSYTVESTALAHPVRPQWLGFGKLAAALPASSSVTVSLTYTLRNGCGVTIIVAEYAGITVFRGKSASTVNTTYKALAPPTTGAPGPGGTLEIVTWVYSLTVAATVAVTATFVKRLQTRYNPGRFSSSTATKWITQAVADRVGDTTVHWTPGGWLAAWLFSLA